MKKILLFVPILFLVGCTNFSLENKADPEPTSTIMSEEEIVSTIFTPEFFHIDELGLDSGAIMDSNPKALSVRNIANFQSFFGVNLIDKNGENKGIISAFLFKDEYLSIAKEMQADANVTSLGLDSHDDLVSDQISSVWDDAGGGGAIFRVCNILVSVQTKELDPTIVVDYSKRMINRLLPYAICDK